MFKDNRNTANLICSAFSRKYSISRVNCQSRSVPYLGPDGPPGSYVDFTPGGGGGGGGGDSASGDGGRY